MRKLSIIAGAAFIVLGLASCSSSKTLYSWHDYEDATYKYTKNPDEKKEEKMIKQYIKVLEKQKGTRKIVPPGIYAEYGFLLAKSGKKDEGVKLLEKEIDLYPESKSYVSRIIEQLKK